MEPTPSNPEDTRWQKPDKPMKVSALGIALIKGFEKCRLHAYQDSAGVWTLGWGNTFYESGRPVKKGDTITQARADLLFLGILDRFERDVNRLLTRRLLQHEYDPLVSFAYNVGSDIDQDNVAEGLGDSTLLKLVNSDAPVAQIRAEFAKWNKSGGKVSAGLIRRRKAEAHMYATGELNFFE